MEKSSAAKIVSQTFQNPFDRDSFVYFIKSLLNHIEAAPFVYRGNFIPDAYKPYIKTLERIGKYQDKDDKKIDLLIVHLKKEKSLERARTMQRNFIAWYLNGSRGDIMKDAALVAFVSPNSDDWRFSLVKMDYRLDASGEKVKVKQELTPARRLSFLVGKTESSHTAQSRLAPILQDDDNEPMLKDLEDAFSIEKVTKEFFEKYRGLFLKVKEALDEVVKKDKKIEQDFKRKNIDTVNFTKKLLGQIVFLYFLQKKGWFGVERDEDWGTGPKNFLRLLFEKGIAKYGNFFNEILEPLFYEALAVERTDDFYSRFNCKIPFLNGGLFDPLNNYDWIHTDILLPNELFSNSAKTKEGDIGTGILDIFDRYNFTVKEDEPLEKEVAVDPEMLGKVFENLLEVKDRKSKGTYYTPREIVHYMCQQSLINYLKTETKIEEEKIERIVKQDVLLTKDEYLKWKKEKQKPKNKALALWEGEWKVLDKALENIRIVDPACGSGAFLVGMLQEIVRARKLLQLFNNQKESIYTIKEKSIKNSIYGVDIDPGAIEIAKLRLWLSLIVEEEDIKQIRPLPNLDYKIICGNSLLGIEKNLLNFPLFDKLEKLKPLFFNETNNRKKQAYKNQIDELIEKITNGYKDFDFEIYFSEVFHEKKGFDVVIANPPYIRIHKQEQNKRIKEFIKKTYISAYKDFDYYVLFIEKGLNILKKDGILTYITPDKYLVREYGSRVRSLILKYSIVELFDLSRATDIFDAATYPLISIIQKNNNLDEVTTKIARTIQNLTNQYKKVVIPKQRCVDNDRIEIIEPEANKLLIKIFTQSSKLSDILKSDQLFCGTPRAKDYHSWAKYIFGSKKTKKCLRVLVCSNIQPYVINHKKKVRTVGLSIFAPYFCNTDQLISETRWNKFTFKPKILIRGNDTRITASLDKEGSVFIGIYAIKVYSNIADDYKYLLASLNSKLYQWIFSAQNPSIKIGGEFFSINSPHILKLPFKKIPQKQRKLFNELVDKIHVITKNEDYLQNEAKQKKVKEYEHQIDKMVYKLYGLTKEEIRIVEGSFNK